MLRRSDVLMEEINKEKWRLNYLHYLISSTTLEKADVLFQTKTIEILCLLRRKKLNAWEGLHYACMGSVYGAFAINNLHD